MAITRAILAMFSWYLASEQMLIMYILSPEILRKSCPVPGNSVGNYFAVAVFKTQAPILSILIFDDEITEVVFADDLNRLNANPTPMLANFFNEAHVMTHNV